MSILRSLTENLAQRGAFIVKFDPSCKKKKKKKKTICILICKGDVLFFPFRQSPLLEQRTNFTTQYLFIYLSLFIYYFCIATMNVYSALSYMLICN